MSEQIRREFTLNYPIEQVKKAIVDACRTSTGSYQIKDRNEVFNSYSISLVKMLSVLPITIQMKKISDTETHIELSAVTGPQLSRNPTFVAQMIDEFLGKVGDFVSGKLIVKQPTPRIQNNNPPSSSRTTIVFIVVVLIIIGVIIFIYKT